MNLKQLHALEIPVFGDTNWRGQCPAETVDQVTVVNWLRTEYPTTWGRLVIHPRNEGQLRRQQHKIMIKAKAEGMTKGASDIIIPGRPALAMEIKRKDHTKSKLDQDQRQYLETALSIGAYACVALGWEGAIAGIQRWLTLQPERPDVEG